MKKQLLILIGIILAGGLVIQLLNLNDNKELEQTQREKNKKQMEDISSTPDTIEKIDIPHEEREPEIFDKNQMYFENIESLYNYFKFSQVEDIKQRVQFYVQQNISKDILDCSIKKDTIKESNGKIIFEISMENVRYLEVQVTKDKNNKIIDCTILHSIL